MPRAALLRPWLLGAAIGAVLGTLFLGIGGRLSMYGIALAQGLPAGWTLGGTATVIFLGTLSGIAAGLMYTATRLVLPQRPWLARVIFGVALLAVTLRGLRPVDAARLLWFMPLFALFAVALDRAWEKRCALTGAQSVRELPA